MAEEKTVRIGKVSSVNFDKGMVRVTYPDRDDSVTAEIPVFSFTDEYKMPKVGSQVLVLHLSNGAAAGVCLGHYWNQSNTSKVTGKDVFRKELAQTFGDAFMQYKDGTLTIFADKVEIKAGSSVKIDAPTITATADMEIDGFKFKQHTHTGAHGETSRPH